MKQLGLFWDIEPPKSSEARKPPAPVWLAPDYLPGLAEALRFRDRPMMSRAELEQARINGEPMICDCEIYPNYFLVAFTSFETGKVWYCEAEGVEASLAPLEMAMLSHVLSSFLIVTFNGNGFDLPMLALAVVGKSVAEIKHACNMIILQEIKPWQVLKGFRVEPLKINHIDLIEVAPQSANLKIYGGRLHVPCMRDLPFNPETMLSTDQIAILRHYCINDLTTTAFLFANLQEQLSIRAEMSVKYGLDLRSKSDAQVAEAVIKAELKRINGFDSYPPEILPGTTYLYHVPEYLQFQSDELNQLLADISQARFVVQDSGGLWIPDELIDPDCRHFTDPKKRKSRKVMVAGKAYRLGIGGLHSCEESISHKAGSGFKLVDRDVASYYPAIILNQRLHPIHLGYDFITVYRSLVERRLRAKDNEANKAAGTVDKVLADMMKIVLNGSYGKFGSKWSALYAPDLMIQVTITGQLSLLMLIESLERSGIEVCSANTDGVVMRYPETMQYVVDSVVSDWEHKTGFITEETPYSALYCRDVNNYVAIKPDGKSKTKGAFFSPWGLKGFEIFRFAKNPTNTICVDAVLAYLINRVPVAQTVRASRDLSKFLTVREVKGGGVKDGVFLGKAVRWYYSANCGGEIVYAKSGNKVPKSDGAKPCMELPDSFPTDLDFNRYEAEAVEILRDIAAI